MLTTTGSMTKADGFRQYGVHAVALLAGAVVFWLALHCDSSDWFISETHADIIYTGLRRFREFPFFSFVVNGGTYFIQDPQSNLFSPAVPLVYLFGPSIGLRLNVALWATLGVYLFVWWMRRRVSIEAALIAASASVLGLGVLWKVAAGNDMFLWHLGLPALLWGVENVLHRPKWPHALSLGVVLGLLLLGPTFHSFTYLFLFAVPSFILVELWARRPDRRELLRILVCVVLACVIALLIASPKIACWLKFPMKRPTGDAGVLSPLEALRDLFDYARTRHTLVPSKSRLPGGSFDIGHVGLEECAMALPPLGSVLALFGAYGAIRRRLHRTSVAFACILLFVGLVLECSGFAWDGFRWLTHGNFRVAPRFLALPCFGLAIFCALGAEMLLTRAGRSGRYRWLITLGATVAMFGSAIAWTWRAERQPPEAAYSVTVDPVAMNPLETMADERDAIRRLSSFSEVAKFDPDERAILDGIGYKDGFLIVGNRFKSELWRTRSRHKRAVKADRPASLLVGGMAKDEATFAHSRIVLNDIPPHSRVRLRILMPKYGLTHVAVPPSADISIRRRRFYVDVLNHGSRRVRRVTLRANWPISEAWFAVSGATLTGALAAILWRLRQQRKEAQLGRA